CGAEATGHCGKFAVGDHLAPRQVAQDANAGSSERRELVEVELDVRERVVLPGEERLQPRDQSRREFVTRRCAAPRYRSVRGARLPPGGPAPGSVERVRARQLVPEDASTLEPHLPHAPAI